MLLQVSATNDSEFAARMAYALWAYLHRCCKRLGTASIKGTCELKPGFVGSSEISQAPTTLTSCMWRIYAQDNGRRAMCFVRVQVGDHEPDSTGEVCEALSLWPPNALYVAVVGAQRVEWSSPAAALQYLDGEIFPEPV